MFRTRKLWAGYTNGSPIHSTLLHSSPILHFRHTSILRPYGEVQSYMKPSWHDKADRHAATRTRSRDQRIAEARLWLLALQCVDLPSLSVGFVPQSFVLSQLC